MEKFGILTKDIVEKYKRHWALKDARDAAAREKLRRDALRTSEKLKDILRDEFHVKKVILFGSVLKKKYFTERSDIDIAVEGLKRNAYFIALARLMMESRFDIDLKPVEEANELLSQRIAKGKVLYEKRDHS